MKRRTNLPLLLSVMIVVFMAVTVFAVACGDAGESPVTTARQSGDTVPPSAATAAQSDLILASTTSTQDSGLFDALIPAFNAVYPQYTVKVVAVGSGEALKLGETGDADVLLVHSPASEEAFMEAGHGVDRQAVMYNDFIIVGPSDDPAQIRGMSDAAAAYVALADEEALFFSRGDDSGTHNKEKSIWKGAGLEPSGEWYQTTGQGMGETLTIADQKGGYTLSDRATYLSKKDSLNLEILVEGDKALFNQYHVITCAEASNAQGAGDFLDWIVNRDAQENVIAPFGVEKYGQPLFIPNAGQAE